MSVQELDQAKVDAFAQRLLTTINGGMLTLMMSVGHRTGLFDTMATMGAATSAEIAAAAELSERYVREWIGAMTTGGIVEHDPVAGTYRLPPEHAAMVRRGEYHFLYSNHNFIKENEESGYRVFARPKEDAGTGEIVVLKDSPIRTLADLEGQEVAFPHTAAFFGYHLPMDALMRKGIQVKVRFAGNQEGAMGQLKAGRVVAAGVNAEVMRAFAQRENLAYRTLWSSDKYLSLALSALPSVPADAVKAVREAFLKMADEPEGAKVLASSANVLKQATPMRFVASKDSEFDNMRKFYRTTLVKVELQ